MMTKPEYKIKRVNWQHAQKALTNVRMTVFVDEQKIPKDLELDGFDTHCIHVMASDPKNKTIGVARMLEDGHIGRLAVLREYRNKGIGSALLNTLIEIARSHSFPQVYLFAQISAVTFYQKHRFVQYGEEFMDAGIPHIAMQLKLKS